MENYFNQNFINLTKFLYKFNHIITNIIKKFTPNITAMWSFIVNNKDIFYH